MRYCHLLKSRRYYHFIRSCHNSVQCIIWTIAASSDLAITQYVDMKYQYWHMLWSRYKLVCDNSLRNINQISNLFLIITLRLEVHSNANQLLHVRAVAPISVVFVFVFMYLCICRWETCSNWTARQSLHTPPLCFAGRSIRRRQGPSKVLQYICIFVYFSIFQSK